MAHIQCVDKRIVEARRWQKVRNARTPLVLRNNIGGCETPFFFVNSLLPLEGNQGNVLLTQTMLHAACLRGDLAIQKLIAKGELAENPFTESVAAVSVGVYQNTPVLDLNYPEDKNATVDANLVMTGSGKYVEVQSSGEEATFTREELNALLDLGAKGIQEINELQNVAIAEGLKA